MDKAIKEAVKKMDKLIVKEILTDPDLTRLLQPFFTEETGRQEFVKKCLARRKTRRMLLRLQWHVEIADDMEKVKLGRPALNLIFLMALAESIAKQRIGKKSSNPLAVVKEFFKHVSKEDRQTLQREFRRTLLKPKTQTLRFSSIIRILYEVRNKAVHGEDFWNFSLLPKEEKEKYIRKGYHSYGLLTEGFLGKRGKKRRISIDTVLTYEDLRGIFIRTAIANIKTLL